MIRIKIPHARPGHRVVVVVLGLCFVVAFAAVGVKLLTGSHAQTPQAAKSCTVSNIAVNSCRAWVGAEVGGNPGAAGNTISQFNYLENTLVGKPLDIYRSYHADPTSDNCPSGQNCLPGTSALPLSSTEKYFAAQGKMLDINWNPALQYKDAESVADGGTQYINDNIVATAKAIKSIAPTKVFFSPWHETNLGATSNTPGCVINSRHAYGSPADFIKAWQNMHNIFQQQGVTNVEWTLNYSSYKPHDCQVPLLWPGSQYVDWVIYDSYDHDGPEGTTYADTVGRFYDVLKSEPGTIGQQINSKPWGLGEFGTCLDPSPTNAQQFFLDAANDYANNTYPNLKMYVVFTNPGAPGAGGGTSGDACLTDYDSNGSKDMTKQADFNKLVDNILGSTSSSSPTPTVKLNAPASGATVSGNNVTVSASASVSSGSIKSITLKTGGTVLATCSAATCSHAWDTTSLSNGSVTLEADTTASDGKTASATETVTVKNANPVSVTPPSNVTSPSQTTTSVGLEWKAGTDSKYPASQLSYQIDRDGSKVDSTSAGKTAYTNTGLSPGTYYSYTLVTDDPAGNQSSPSAAFTQETKVPDCAKPAAPQSLSGKAVSPTSVALTWKAVPDPSAGCTVTGYVVSRNSVPLGQPDNPAYTDSTATASSTYTYSVVAVETGNIAGKSSSVKVTTPASTKPDPGPSAPNNVVATAVSSTQVNVTWNASTDPVTGIKDYEVLRDGKQVGTSATTSFGDSGLSASTQYRYQVVAVSGGGKTATSSTVTVTTPSDTQGGGSGGSTGGGGGNGSGASDSSDDSPYVPPILQGTTSVGSGSETGNDTTDNPTDPGDSTSNELAPSQGQPAAKSKGLNTKQVAFVGTGGTLVVILLVGGVWWWFKRRDSIYQPTLSDPDLASHVIVGGEDNNGQGPYPPYGPPGGQ